eukprot:6044278-Prymnesium_polylepis.1
MSLLPLRLEPKTAVPSPPKLAGGHPYLEGHIWQPHTARPHIWQAAASLSRLCRIAPSYAVELAARGAVRTLGGLLL